MRRARTAAKVAIALLLAHVALGTARLPGKVCARRFEMIDDYRKEGAAAFLLGDAKLGGAAELEWVLANTPERCVVLWRWPADGALEFAGALLAPRLVVDERDVPRGATTFAGLPIATGTVPSGEHGLIMLQGTDDHGLRLLARPD